MFSAQLVVSLSHRSRRQGSWVGDDIMERRLLDALVLTLLELRNFSTVCQRQSNSRCHGICKLCPDAMLLLPVSGGEHGSLVVYMHIGVGSALLVSTNWAMRRPQKGETSNRYRFSRFSYIYNKVSTGDTHAESGELIGK